MKNFEIFQSEISFGVKLFFPVVKLRFVINCFFYGKIPFRFARVKFVSNTYSF